MVTHNEYVPKDRQHRSPQIVIIYPSVALPKAITTTPRTLVRRETRGYSHSSDALVDSSPAADVRARQTNSSMLST